jgi:hypothetical protein
VAQSLKQQLEQTSKPQAITNNLNLYVNFFKFSYIKTV